MKFVWIEEAITEGSHRRGMDGIGRVLRGQLKEAVCELYHSRCIFVLTGFVIRDTMTGETDGPLGAVSIVRALEMLGKEVVIITDGYSVDILKQLKEAMKLESGILSVPFEGAVDFLKQAMDDYGPTHVLAIERPGRSAEGIYHTMNGESLNDLVPDTDCLFQMAKTRGVKTIAIGDGGNEIGMGNVSTLVKNHVRNGAAIAAAESCHLLVLATVSNWGGYGITAGLSLFSGKNLLNPPETESELLAVMVQAGAVDGCSRKSDMTVDGLSLEENLAVVDRLQQIICR